MTAEVLKNTFLFFLLQQILALTEAEWQEMARGHNILLKQTQESVLMSEQKVKLERAERLPRIAIVAADHLDVRGAQERHRLAQAEPFLYGHHSSMRRRRQMLCRV